MIGSVCPVDDDDGVEARSFPLDPAAIICADALISFFFALVGGGVGGRPFTSTNKLWGSLELSWMVEPIEEDDGDTALFHAMELASLGGDSSILETGLIVLGGLRG